MHHEKNSLFVVEAHLDLIQLAIDVALDNVKSVKNAMESNLLRYPVESWDEDSIPSWLKEIPLTKRGRSGK